MSNLSTAQRLEVAEKRNEEVTGQLATAASDLTAARAEIETLKATAADLSAKVESANASAIEAKVIAEKATADLAALAAVNAELAAKEQDIEKRATAKAAAVVAVVGATSAPLPVTATSTKTEKPASNLTGLARAIAAHESSKK
jgi:chromosome segregation ATPase